MIKRIVVGTDGTDGSRDALRWAAEQAHELGAETVAVFAVRPTTEFLMALPPMSNDYLDRARDALEDTWCRPLREAQVPYRALIVEDEPAHALLEVAEREGADMIVLGANSHGNLADRLLGSVTYKVAHRAHCPVVIVPGASHGAVA